jgi:hypothetical protein
MNVNTQHKHSTSTTANKSHNLHNPPGYASQTNPNYPHLGYGNISDAYETPKIGVLNVAYLRNITNFNPTPDKDEQTIFQSMVCLCCFLVIFLDCAYCGIAEERYGEDLCG